MLTEFQRAVWMFVVEESGRPPAVRMALEMDGLYVPDEKVVGGYAYALYHDLRAAGHKIEFDDETLRARKVPPTDPDFFRSTAVQQKLVKLVGAVA